jgi:hypothetical protein
MDIEVPHSAYNIEIAIEFAMTPGRRYYDPICCFIAVHYFHLLSLSARGEGKKPESDHDAERSCSGAAHGEGKSGENCFTSSKSDPHRQLAPHNFKIFSRHNWYWFTLLLALAHKLHGEELFELKFFVAHMPSTIMSAGGISRRFDAVLLSDFTLLEFEILKLFDFNLHVDPAAMLQTLRAGLSEDEAAYVQRTAFRGYPLG